MPVHFSWRCPPSSYVCNIRTCKKPQEFPGASLSYRHYFAGLKMISFGSTSPNFLLQSLSRNRLSSHTLRMLPLPLHAFLFFNLCFQFCFLLLVLCVSAAQRYCIHCKYAYQQYKNHTDQHHTFL